jgi:hypothetical protein
MPQYFHRLETPQLQLSLINIQDLHQVNQQHSNCHHVGKQHCAHAHDDDGSWNISIGDLASYL